ncbi:hypothetical protein F4778DRAFT_217220 [Xylariomycetidae sp. FL2044]|nr:hypothetical protein F4778DRAFT_217220 [Xylariomycetidae sp. FL2044]
MPGPKDGKGNPVRLYLPSWSSMFQVVACFGWVAEQSPTGPGSPSARDDCHFHAEPGTANWDTHTHTQHALALIHADTVAKVLPVPCYNQWRYPKVRRDLILEHSLPIQMLIASTEMTYDDRSLPALLRDFYWCSGAIVKHTQAQSVLRMLEEVRSGCTAWYLGRTAAGHVVLIHTPLATLQYGRKVTAVSRSKGEGNASTATAAEVLTKRLERDDVGSGEVRVMRVFSVFSIQVRNMEHRIIIIIASSPVHPQWPVASGAGEFCYPWIP